MRLDDHLVFRLGVDHGYRRAVMVRIAFMYVRLDVVQPKPLARPLKSGRRGVIDVLFEKRKGFVGNDGYVFGSILFLFSHERALSVILAMLISKNTKNGAYVQDLNVAGGGPSRGLPTRKRAKPRGRWHR